MKEIFQARNSAHSDAEKLHQKSRATRGGHRTWYGPMHGGYPMLESGGKRRQAHRIAFELANGPLEPGQWLRNLCGRRDCIDANHWQVGGKRRRATAERTRRASAAFDPFEGRVVIEGDCHIWTGRTNHGYGVISSPGNAAPRLAHRVAYEEESKQPLPRGAHLHHVCRNSRCVNPAHLLPVAAGGKFSHKALHKLEDEFAAAFAAEGLPRDVRAWPGPPNEDTRRIGSLEPSEVMGGVA